MVRNGKSYGHVKYLPYMVHPMDYFYTNRLLGYMLETISLVSEETNENSRGPSLFVRLYNLNDSLVDSKLCQNDIS